jgi:hypothetical protein
LPKSIKNKKVRIWFQDEARIGQQGTISRMWTQKGIRPRAVRQLKYEYAYIFGAVCPEKDDSAAIIAPYVGINVMKAHLKIISKKVASDEFAVVVLDRASWHTSKKINTFKNIALLPLPPVSPELNPQEQVWQQLRKKYLANRTFHDYIDIQNSCCNAWNSYFKKSGQVKSLCSRSWASFDNQIV